MQKTPPGGWGSWNNLLVHCGEGEDHNFSRLANPDSFSHDGGETGRPASLDISQHNWEYTSSQSS